MLAKVLREKIKRVRMTPDIYTRYIEIWFEENRPDLAAAISDDKLTLTVSWPDGERQLYGLGNFYRSLACSENVDDAQEVIAEFLQRNIALSEDTVHHPANCGGFEELSSIIRARIHPIQVLKTVPYPVAHYPFYNNCAVVFVFDQPESVVPVPEVWVKHYKIEQHDLKLAALRNLGNSTARWQPCEIMDARCVVVNTGDCYDASRLLLLEHESDLRSKIEDTLQTGAYAAFIPYRDILVAIPEGTAAMRQMRIGACKMVTKLPYPISEKPFAIMPGGIGEVVDDVKGGPWDLDPEFARLMDQKLRERN